MWALTVSVRRLLVLLLLLLLLSERRAADAFGQDSYGALYQMGKDAYLEEDYRSCVGLLLQALQEQRQFEQLLVDCRDRCRREAAAETLLLTGGETGDDQLPAFERLIRETRCLVQCQRGQLGDHLQRYYDSAWADDEFRSRKPYEYLQLCYYKTGEVQKAANAVFTVLLQQPNNEIMKENFKYYTTMEGVNNADIVSLEPQEHTELYMRGNDAYEAGRWPRVTQLMEEALEEFIEAEQRCRTLCERFFPQGFNPDFVANVANHFAYVLRCKIRCPEQLSTVAGNYLSDYLESHFHYLQFAYYKQNMLREACSNVANYLLFKPQDKDMLGNRRLYLKQEGVDESFFTPRPDILELSKRKEREEKLDNYILQNFRFDSDETRKKGNDVLRSSSSDIPQSAGGRPGQGFSGTGGGPPEVPRAAQRDPRTGQDGPGTGQDYTGAGYYDAGADQDDTTTNDPGEGHGVGPGDSVSDQDNPGEGQGAGLGDPGGSGQEDGALLALHGRVMAGASVPPPGPWLSRAVISRGADQMGGPRRFVADHLLTPRECQRLTDLVQAVGATGDGYRRRKPLSRHEQLRGLSFGRLVVAVDRGDASLYGLRLMLDVADAARLMVARQLDVDRLYPSFTHLVTRTHVPDLSANRSRSELSHAIHVDNCQLFTNGTCSRGRGAFIHRHFSAVLYLNDDFTGGEFVFADNIVSRRPTVRVRPRCGRLVGFSAGPENPHGVLAVTGGSRHALAMWYTRTRRRREDEHMAAELYLHDSTATEVRQMVSILERNFETADRLLKR